MSGILFFIFASCEPLKVVINIDTIKDIIHNEHNLIFESYAPEIIGMADRQLKYVKKKGCVTFLQL